MTATLEYIETKFRFYNDLIFNTELKDVPFRTYRARRSLGLVRFRRTLLSRKVIDLGLNCAVDLPENELDDILIHEMIHLYIFQKHIHDSSAHGPVFRRYMSQINHTFGRNITISRKIETQSKIISPKKRVLFLSDSESGKYIVVVIAPSSNSVSRLKSYLEKEYHSVRIFNIVDPFFEKYFSRGPRYRLYKVSREEIDEHIRQVSVTR